MILQSTDKNQYQLSAVNLYLSQDHPANNNEPFKDPREDIKASGNFPNLLRVVDFPPDNNPVGTLSNKIANNDI